MRASSERRRDYAIITSFYEVLLYLLFISLLCFMILYFHAAIYLPLRYAPAFFFFSSLRAFHYFYADILRLLLHLR